MNIRASSRMASSLNVAAFRTVLARGARGLIYRLRREILTLRQLRQDPFPAGLVLAPRGRIRTSRDVRTMTSRWTRRECEHEY
jgi:hypothetical protein